MAIIFGLTFVVVGLMGFVENPIASESGFFQANWAHNQVHLITGVVFLLGVIIIQAKKNALCFIQGIFMAWWPY
ncbi:MULTISPECIES: hypothetical protein [Methylomonas]|uniref:DUF4383 domain-containing protein n=1 Tax=Methylomonas defluvii TaxID=3045149 RepID=A0ABU4UFC8_9GAMM|nr:MULTISPECIES: hypothetical protein [unclassified Methylomonas]MDX8128049.1 hypothetical protein [Methylomonas sp. OY6]